MNIMEYRALKAEMEKEQQQSDSQGKEQTDAQAQQTSTPTDEGGAQTQTKTNPTTTSQGEQTPTQTESNPNQGEKPQLPEFIEIDGQKLPLEELKNGYLRQADYTRKTQELAEAKRRLQYAEQLYNAIYQNPEVAQQVAEQFNLPYLDPNQAQVMELQNKYYDLLIEKEVNDLRSKYGDFDVYSVLQFAYDRQISNLEDAYHLYNSYYGANQSGDESLDIETIKEQIRQEILQELKSNVDTTSIIQGRGDSQPIQVNTPTLTEEELKVAQALNMSPEEYAKWRDAR